MDQVLIFVLIFLYGILIGSFLNVCIYRIPKNENIVVVRSHCMSCGYQLKWYDLFPVFSYLFLGGKCRKCKTKISFQYPFIEMLNGVLYLMVFAVNGLNGLSIIFCLLTSVLIVLTVVDLRTFEIPDSFQVVIAGLGIFRVAMDYKNWQIYIIGFFAISVFLLLLYIFSKGTWIGGGDVKLMAVTGLILGWKLIIIAFFLGCVLGSVIHLLRMKLSKENRVLAFGPYLSLGIFLTMLYGEQWLQWYIGICLR
jgi:leader peptidase (prepilin peptidase) / N-methyltransferase